MANGRTTPTHRSAARAVGLGFMSFRTTPFYYGHAYSTGMLAEVSTDDSSHVLWFFG